MADGGGRGMRGLRGKAGARWRVAVFVLAVGVVLLWRPAGAHLRAASLLMRFNDSGAEGAKPSVTVDEAMTAFDGTSGPVRAREYVPRGVGDAPGLVMVHGVHHLGIDEPRLVRFARSIAEAGVRVLTPEIAELADYRVDARSIDTIGRAAHAYAERTRGARASRTVGVMGFSFAGGLALLAAADARFAPDIGFVVSVGAHDDLARVARFFATDTIVRPDGTSAPMKAHEYGPLVLLYAHAEDFFPAADVDVAREALRLWLWEMRDEARALAKRLSEPSRAVMESLFDRRVDVVAPALLAEIERRADAMASVSPHGRLANVHAPVFLLHGASDSVIPASETAWLAEDLPKGVVRGALVTNAVGHVEMEAAPTWGDQWAVLHFMAEVLETAS